MAGFAGDTSTSLYIIALMTLNENIITKSPCCFQAT